MGLYTVYAAPVKHTVILPPLYMECQILKWEEPLKILDTSTLSEGEVKALIMSKTQGKGEYMTIEADTPEEAGKMFLKRLSLTVYISYSVLSSLLIGLLIFLLKMYVYEMWSVSALSLWSLSLVLGFILPLPNLLIKLMDLNEDL